MSKPDLTQSFSRDVSTNDVVRFVREKRVALVKLAVFTNPIGTLTNQFPNRYRDVLTHACLHLEFAQIEYGPLPVASTVLPVRADRAQLPYVCPSFQSDLIQAIQTHVAVFVPMVESQGFQLSSVPKRTAPQSPGKLLMGIRPMT